MLGRLRALGGMGVWGAISWPPTFFIERGDLRRGPRLGLERGDAVRDAPVVDRRDGGRVFGARGSRAEIIHRARRRTSGSTVRPSSSMPARMSSCLMPGQAT